MKKIGSLLLVLVVGTLSGCQSLDRIAQSAVNEAVRSSTEEIRGTSSGRRVSQSVDSEKIAVVNPSRTSRDYGHLKVSKTERNPKGQTQVAIDTCIHPSIGNLRCGGYLFEVTPEGWLKKDPIRFDQLNRPVITLAAGTYYVKFHNTTAGKKYYTTGEITIEPFVTNYVKFEFE